MRDVDVLEAFDRLDRAGVLFWIGGGRGAVATGGREVPCLSPELRLRLHNGYDLEEDDRRDVRLLTQRFELAVRNPRHVRT